MLSRTLPLKVHFERAEGSRPAGGDEEVAVLRPRRPGSRRLGTARVAGRSMLPTLRSGDRLLLRYGATPRPGGLVVVRLPGRGLSVKRAAFRLPEGWWVERDNPAEGVDSWLVGAIPPHHVVAVVVCRYWPPHSHGSRRLR